MIDDMLKLSVDQFYADYQSTDSPANNNDVFPVPGYDDNENMFELLFNLRDRKSRRLAKQEFV